MLSSWTTGRWQMVLLRHSGQSVTGSLLNQRESTLPSEATWRSQASVSQQRLSLSHHLQHGPDYFSSKTAEHWEECPLVGLSENLPCASSRASPRTTTFFSPSFQPLCGISIPLSYLFPNQNARLDSVSFSASIYVAYTNVSIRNLLLFF